MRHRRAVHGLAAMAYIRAHATGCLMPLRGDFKAHLLIWRLPLLPQLRLPGYHWAPERSGCAPADAPVLAWPLKSPQGRPPVA